jgi:small-conductance mechanosensitive channel
MRRSVRLLALALGLVGAASLLAQTPAPPGPACDTVVTEQYRQLVADRLLQPDQQTQSAPWTQHLAAISAQLRVVTTQYTMKRNQAEQAEGNAAVLFEQVRQLQQGNAQLRTELEQVKNGKEAPAPAAER